MKILATALFLTLVLVPAAGARSRFMTAAA
jgi:hypothetical protein